jgi:predicted acetyltransferase
MIDLVTPSLRYRDSFLAGAAEFHSLGRLDSTYATYLGFDLARLKWDFNRFVEKVIDLADRVHLPDGWHPDHVHWLIHDDEYIGQSSIRPDLGTMYLITYGGHIGYSIRPERRQRGYGQRILGLTLKKAREVGLAKVLITCDEDNIASKKIIEANGGVFEQAMIMDADILTAEGRAPDQPVAKLRYWIDLEPRPEELI